MSRIPKSLSELKWTYWNLQGWSPTDIAKLEKEYGDNPATMGEASYVLHERVIDLLALLPVVGRFIR